MRLITRSFYSVCFFALTACISKGPNPDDPYESINRKTQKFNHALDGVILKPIAKLYRAVLPAAVRASVNNAYDNVNMIPSAANDLLQGDYRYAIKDTWRFIFNSTFGVAGLFDVAATRFGLPPHSNDLGLTFAKWGNQKSPYIVLPLLGPSTIRDAMGDMFQYAILTPYPYISNQIVLYSLLGVRYVDLRAQFLDNEALIKEAIDPYSFVRDAYLQHRNYKIQAVLGSHGKGADDAVGATENNEPLGNDYVGE